MQDEKALEVIIKTHPDEVVAYREADEFTFEYNYKYPPILKRLMHKLGFK